MVRNKMLEFIKTNELSDNVQMLLLQLSNDDAIKVMNNQITDFSSPKDRERQVLQTMVMETDDKTLQQDAKELLSDYTVTTLEISNFTDDSMKAKDALISTDSEEEPNPSRVKRH